MNNTPSYIEFIYKYQIEFNNLMYWNAEGSRKVFRKKQKIKFVSSLLIP